MAEKLQDFPPKRAWGMLAILAGLYIISFIDRFALGLLVEPLKKDLAVNDVQIGLLFGTAFGIFYGAMGLPLARIADRFSRKWLIICCVVLWSSCTVGSGFASSFSVLVILRIGLAIGEAALSPSVYSLIGDLFPPKSRTLAATLYNASGMIGVSLAYVAGAELIAIITRLSPTGIIGGFQIWQIVLILCGLPGLLLAAIFAILGREPVRPPVPGELKGESLASVFRFAVSKGWLYLSLFLGAGFSQFATNAFIAWSPTYLSRRYGMTMVEAGRAYGYHNMIALVGGALVIPIIAKKLGDRRPEAIIWTAAVCVFLGAVACVASAFQTNAEHFLLFVTVGLFLSMGAGSAVLTSVHLITPPSMRATLFAMILICLTTLSYSVAPPLAALLSKLFPQQTQALLYGAAMVSALGGTLSCTLFLIGLKPFRRYLEEEATRTR